MINPNITMKIEAQDQKVCGDNTESWQTIIDFFTEINKCNTEVNQQVLDKFLLDLARDGASCDLIQFLLNNTNKKYPFSINATDKEGHSLASFFSHEPEMQKWLFKNGYIPRGNELLKGDLNIDLNVIINDAQSVHNSEVVRATNFYTKLLLQQFSDLQNWDIEASDVMGKIAQLSLLINKNKILPFTMLNLSLQQKEDIFKKINLELKDECFKNPELAIDTICDKAREALMNIYI
ncbi:hypothetical protein [Candidatus Trichorickettsia mobilis]|uniref:hypothetical protein n=1 Tax=Candidatus Trichorickettsia mobilis TaxID=1346319 RepID=UPI0029318FEC|nr:hypothetical protein [Candidatus Trichorickettsia mobilis]